MLWIEAHSSSILRRLSTSYASVRPRDTALPNSDAVEYAVEAAVGYVDEVTGLEHDEWEEPTVAAVLAMSGVTGHCVEDDDDEQEEGVGVAAGNTT